MPNSDSYANERVVTHPGSCAESTFYSADALWDHLMDEFVICFPGEIKSNSRGSVTRDDHYLSAGADVRLGVPQLPADRRASRKRGQCETPASQRLLG